jgi:hypothetical protein
VTSLAFVPRPHFSARSRRAIPTNRVARDVNRVCTARGVRSSAKTRARDVANAVGGADASWR